MTLSLSSSVQKLYFCEYSLHFFKRRTQLLRHLSKCKLRHPPGDEIYRKDNISMFEVRHTQHGAWDVGGTLVCMRHALAASLQGTCHNVTTLASCCMLL